MDRASQARSPPRRWRRRAGRLGAAALSAGAHAGLLLALLIAWHTSAPPAVPAPVDVSLAPPFAPAPPKPAAAAPAKPSPQPAAPTVAPARAPAPPLAARPTAASPTPEALAVAPAARAGDGAGLTDAELAGAASAGSGGGSGGGACDMARRVETALRNDPLARAAVHAAAGRAVMIWNGDWVQSTSEDGKGLAAVREAITWEVAFAPPACRQAHVRGLVLLSLDDGSARLALGAGEWRWSDLLGVR